MNWSISPLVLWALLAILAGLPVICAGALMIMRIERRYGSRSDPFAGR